MQDLSSFLSIHGKLLPICTYAAICITCVPSDICTCTVTIYYLLLLQVLTTQNIVDVGLQLLNSQAIPKYTLQRFNPTDQYLNILTPN